MVDGARDLCARDGQGGPLFQRLYSAICADRHEAASGGKHEVKVFEELASSAGFQRKGERVALRRWFSWLNSASWHDSEWHSRLLSI
eukprot:9795881-Lingulodinium_polyedra.AAC.1